MTTAGFPLTELHCRSPVASCAELAATEVVEGLAEFEGVAATGGGRFWLIFVGACDQVGLGLKYALKRESRHIHSHIERAQLRKRGRVGETVIRT
jgi:hypothetical protein